MSQQQARPSRLVQWTERLSRGPRGLRMLLCALIALATAMLFAQVVSMLAGPTALTDIQSAYGVMILSVGMGFIIYILGWWTLVGFSGDPHPVLGKRAGNFLLFGILILVVLLVWALINALIAFLPPEIPI